MILLEIVIAFLSLLVLTLWGITRWRRGGLPALKVVWWVAPGVVVAEAAIAIWLHWEPSKLPAQSTASASGPWLSFGKMLDWSPYVAILLVAVVIVTYIIGDKAKVARSIAWSVAIGYAAVALLFLTSDYRKGEGAFHPEIASCAKQPTSTARKQTCTLTDKAVIMTTNERLPGRYRFCGTIPEGARVESAEVGVNAFRIRSLSGPIQLDHWLQPEATTTSCSDRAI